MVSRLAFVLTATFAATMVACTGDGPPESPEPAAVEETAPDQNGTSAADETDDFHLEVHGLDVMIDELPQVWNEAIDTYGSGYTLPSPIRADDEFAGLQMATMASGDATVFVAWDPDSGQVTEIGIDGPVDDEDVSVALTTTAGAMIYATSDRSLAEAESFLVDELMAGIDTFQPDDFLLELIEEPGRAYRFSLGGTIAMWEATGQP